VIVRQQAAAEPHDIVVALLGEEATVKRLVKEGDQLQLRAEHPTMEPLVITPEKAPAILGKVVAVFRRVP